jgi:hypothetical protein
MFHEPFVFYPHTRKRKRRATLRKDKEVMSLLLLHDE